MTRPVYTRLGQRLQERTDQLQPEAVDAEYGYAHGYLCEAMMQPYAQVADVIDPVDPYVPWEPIFNVDICPGWALPWLAQCVGIRLPESVTEAQARDLIRGLGIQKRGSVDAIRTAGDVLLQDPKIVFFRERDDGDPYVLEIVIDTNSIPPGMTSDDILDAYGTQVPAGIVYRHRTVDGWDYQGMTDAGGNYSFQPAYYANYEALSENTPPVV